MLATTKAISVINRLRDERVISKYAIGGAVGAIFYIEPTQTQDIDVFIYLEPKPGQLLISTELIGQRLNELGYTEWQEDKIVIESWPVQFLPAGKLLERQAIEAAVEMPLSAGVSASVPPAEFLIAIAVDLGRPKDISRLYQFHFEQAYDPVRLEALLDEHQLGPKWQRILQLFKEQEQK